MSPVAALEVGPQKNYLTVVALRLHSSCVTTSYPLLLSWKYFCTRSCVVVVYVHVIGLRTGKPGTL